MPEVHVNRKPISLERLRGIAETPAIEIDFDAIARGRVYVLGAQYSGQKVVLEKRRAEEGVRTFKTLDTLARFLRERLKVYRFSVDSTEYKE